MSKDILDGMARIRKEFQDIGLEPPSAILLKSHDEGLRVLDAIRQSSTWSAVVGSAGLGLPVKMADGSVWMEIKIMDISVLWPERTYGLLGDSGRYGLF